MVDTARHSMGAWMRSHPCFYLFSALLLLLVLLPLFENSEQGKLLFTTMNLLILVASVVTLGRSRFSFWVALLLAGPAFALLVMSYLTGSSGYLAWSWRFFVGVFPNATVIATLFLCALSVSGAIFLILELDQPFEGLIQMSSAPLRSAIAHLGQ